MKFLYKVFIIINFFNITFHVLKIKMRINSKIKEKDQELEMMTLIKKLWKI